MVVIEKTRHNVSPLRWFVGNILLFWVFFKLLFLTASYQLRDEIRRLSASSLFFLDNATFFLVNKSRGKSSSSDPSRSCRTKKLFIISVPFWTKGQSFWLTIVGHQQNVAQNRGNGKDLYGKMGACHPSFPDFNLFSDILC